MKLTLKLANWNPGESLRHGGNVEFPRSRIEAMALEVAQQAQRESNGKYRVVLATVEVVASFDVVDVKQDAETLPVKPVKRIRSPKRRTA